MDVFAQYGQESSEEESEALAVPNAGSSTALALKAIEDFGKIVEAPPKPKPEDVLATVTPEEAQKILPIFGPVRPSNQHVESRLYQLKRNHELGHVLQTNEETAKRLKSEFEELSRNRTAKEHRRQAARRDEIESNLDLTKIMPQRAANDDASSEKFLGPWAPFEGEDERNAQLKLVMEKKVKQAQTDVAKIKKMDATSKVEPEFIFNWPDYTRPSFDAPYRDYQGRSWLEAPRQSWREAVKSAIPSKLKSTLTGHKKAVLRVKHLPGPQHLFMTCSLDATCRIWDAVNDTGCVGIYKGHQKGIKDFGFTNDGKRFYTCGLDSNIMLWDTETGKVLSTFGNGKLPFCIAVHPTMNDIVVCGHQNNVAVQYDSRTGQVEQEYNEHLSVVNTVTFCEGGRKLATTSDDKKMFIWEFGMNVVTKHISEPHMHSMPAVTYDSKEENLVCQSMNNSIVIYEAKDRFRMVPKRRFTGHVSAGYAIKPVVSPDGRYLASGDIHGGIWFWDYRACRMLRTLDRGHQSAVMDLAWSRYQPSAIVSCGWDGKVCIWE